MSYPPPPSLFIRPHLGLGDALIINAIVRHFAQGQRVVVPAKHHNVASVQFQFRDQPNIAVVGVRDDAEADAICRQHQFALKLGMFGTGFTFEGWDACMYAQAGLPFEKRWSEFYYKRDPLSEVQPPKKRPFAFVHEDPARKMEIDDVFLPRFPLVVSAARTTIFSWTACIEEAEEIHCIDSSLAILADSIPTKASRLVLHLYSRKDAKPPNFQKKWELLI